MAVIESLQKVTIEYVSLGLGTPATYEKLLSTTNEILQEVRGSGWLCLVPHVAKLIYQLNTLCFIININAEKDGDLTAVDIKHLERESIQLVARCCSFIARISPSEDVRKVNFWLNRFLPATWLTITSSQHRI